jgi:hypothetical protein
MALGETRSVIMAKPTAVIGWSGLSAANAPTPSLNQMRSLRFW